MLESALTIPTKRVRRAASSLLTAGVLALAVGCGGASVSVPPVLPVPLVDKIPLTMGYHLSEDLLGYVHEESLEDSGDWTIEFGSAQATMFDNLLTGMFEAAVPVAGPGGSGQAVDGVLVPSIEEVQFSTPDQTRSDYFEVWVRYRMRLHGRDGALVGEWPLTAYGKANARNYGMNSREPALQAAALAAMRDAMAFFTVQFRTVPAVQAWLKAEAAAQPGGVS
jgi:hypothetical protein